MKEYNGFSSNERARVGRLQLEAVRSGDFPKPIKCELCQSTKGQMQLHNEDYSKPFEDAHPICRSCHLALHVRFTNPERWEKRKAHIRSVRGNGDFWWNALLNEPIDINPAHSLPSDYKVTLYYCVRTASQAIFREELEKVMTEKPGLRVVIVCDDQNQRITAKEMISNSAEDYLLCAPPAMMHYLEEQLRALGVPKHNIRYEDFALT